MGCNNDTDGQATASATGGTGPYIYSWNTGGTAALETGLGAGVYSVTVTDQNGCTSISSATLTANALDNASYSYAAASYCADNSDPTPTITGLTGGAFSSVPAGLSINASTGVIDLSASTPNTYTIAYTTVGTCPNTSNVNVTINSVTASIIVDNNVSCNGGTDGQATVSASEGTAPYTYAWSNGATTATITGISIGTYNVTITDANGCTGSNSVTITEPLEVSSTIASKTDIVIFGENTGAATVSATGGSSPLHISME